MSALLEARQVSKVFGGGLFDKRVTVALDGEITILQPPLRYRCRPRALRTIVPAP